MSNAPANLKSKVVKGSFWVLLTQFSTQIVQFLVSMVLARLLTPNDYGTVALTSIFFAIAAVLVDGGFGTALIQKKDADDLDFNSVFYLNICLSVIVYIALFFAAPWIASFYKTPVLMPIVRVAAIALFFNAINAVQGAELTRKMLFNLEFRISLITCLTSAAFGIAIAALGYGVWALVLASLASGLAGVIARWYIIAWRPKLMFDWHRLKPLFSYGWKLSASSLLDKFFVNLNGLLIGKFYSKPDLAFVNRGNGLPDLVMGQVDGTIGKVTFPALVQMQNDLPRLRDSVRRMLQCSAFLVFPAMTMLAVCSKSIITLLFGNQWGAAVPYMQLACFTYALWPLHTMNLRVYMALGRSDIFFKLEVIKKVQTVLFIMAFFRYGVFAFMAASALAMGPLSLLWNSLPNRKLIGYSTFKQLRDVSPFVLMSGIMATAVFGVDGLLNLTSFCYANTNSNFSLIAVLILQACVGGIVYFGISYLLKLKAMGEYMRIVIKPLGTKFGLKFVERLERRFPV